jgi:single-stranded-DNA-specific exonuclease
MTSDQNLNPLAKRWDIKPLVPDRISKDLSAFPPFLRQLLFARGYHDPESAAAYVSGAVNFSTDPFLIKDMPEAVERLQTAITEGQKITIYGDYDADGVTSTALLVEFITALGGNVSPYIPDRFEEGYGLNLDAVRQLAEEGTQLIITVDCGVRSIAEAELASELGVDMIISDHHGTGPQLPPALAVIDPKRGDDPYPEKFLAGVGLAYKLVQAYLLKYPAVGINADDWLDLVAIGTVVDMAPLKGENRLLVGRGLQKLRQASRQGVYSLAQVAGVDLKKCNTVDLGYRIGPRLNAAGRLESALIAFNLLTTQDPMKAGVLAQQLDSYNAERQAITDEIREKAVEMALGKDPNAFLVFAVDPGFNEGVVGLAASRLSDAFYRPSVVGHMGEETTVASCRSIPEFHITRALDECADLLVRHGGHAAAAGFTVRNENLESLLQQLQEIATRELDGFELFPILEIDYEIQLEKLSPKHIKDIFDALYLLEPTGRENPEAVFASYGVQVRGARAVGSEGKHLKLTLQAGRNYFDAIAFQQGYWLEEMPNIIDIAYRFENNEYNGRSSLQLNVVDIKATE